MKKITLSVAIVLLSLTFIPAQLNAVATNAKYEIAANKTEANPEVKILLDRLQSIKKMDKSEMSSSEKKSLRKEVRSIREQLRTTSGGVYLSVGAVIIILLLLIILL